MIASHGHAGTLESKLYMAFCREFDGESSHVVEKIGVQFFKNVISVDTGCTLRAILREKGASGRLD